MSESTYNKEWIKKKERLIFQNKFITLFNDLVELPSKKQIEHIAIKTRNFSTVFCKTTGNKILLIRQYRYPFSDFSWEFPGGIIDQGEDPVDCAKREVLEETGYSVLSIEQVLKFHPNAMMSTWGYTFLAIVEKFGSQQLEEDEFILINEFDKKDVDELISEGKLMHGPSLMCYYLAKEKQFI